MVKIKYIYRLSLLIVFLGFIACKAEKKEEVQSKISNDPNLMSLNDFIIKNPGTLKPTSIEPSIFTT